MKTETKNFRFDAYHVLPDSPQMQRDFLYVLASLAAKSQDSKAAEIVHIAGLNAILPVQVEGFQEFNGKGFGGLVQLPDEKRPRAVLVGAREFIAESGLEIPAILESSARQWEQDKSSQIWLAGWDSWVRGVIRFVADR